ncbi:MAG: ATPase [Acidobacteria bacterium]|nr:ATPase [Acidobacteriota bacterium]
MYFLGVDGGQSSTTAVIGDEHGLVLGRGEAGPSNHVESESGREKLIAAVEQSVGQAARSAGLDSLPAFAAACFGMSGGPADKRDIIASIIRAESLEVTTDAHIALLGATGGGPGIIVIAGTGSIAYGQNAGGRTMRAGGWGHIFGDEGGGFDIVRQALRAALRHEEGWGPPTALRPALLQATGASTMNELLHLFYTRDFPRDRVAGWAPLVDAAALEGDEVARTLLRQAAQQLATLAGSVRSQLFAPGEVVLVSPIGGVFHSRMLAEWFRILVELEPGATVAPPKHDPAIGALLGAYAAAGRAIQLHL